MNQTLRTLAFLFAAIAPALASAWSATGHHVAAVIAYEAMEPEARNAAMDILREHPQFDELFQPPSGLTEKEAIERWQIGVAACWPDIIRRSSYDRPTWHYQLGATVVIGDADPPAEPGTLPDDATLDTKDLYIGQAVELCTGILADETQSKQDRAIALCWVLHLYADGHQPLHAGSLYALAFPKGDRGGNSIRISGKGNLHAAWDGLLGGKASAGDVRRRVFEMNEVEVEQSQVMNGLEPSVWLEESAELAQSHAYADEVAEPIIAASRGLTDGVPRLKLSDDYFRAAAEVARQRIRLAGQRLAIVVSNAVLTVGEAGLR